jgi:hypothetical protein
MSIVRITRRKDPLVGERVQVLRRWRRKHGGVDLLVVLPNGRKRLIPQAWTDADTAGEVDADAEDPAAAVGTVQDLLAAVVIVSALSRRLREEQAASQSTCEEDNDATCPAQSAPRMVPAATTGRAGPAARARRDRSDPVAGTPDRQGVRRGRGAR